MLEQLLVSLAEMRRPSDAEMSILIVENDYAPRSEHVVAEMRQRFKSIGLHYLLEKEVGIPIARNRGANFAMQVGADLLAFIDDDEQADEDWLCALVEAHRTSDALLLGGPVLLVPPPGPLSSIERSMFRQLSMRSAYKSKRAGANAKNGRHGRVTITTGNWMASVELFAVHHLQFDQAMRFGGGSDAAFFAELKRRDLPVRWVPDAIVRETVSRQRLRPSYQFRRAYSQSISSFHRKLSRSRSHLLSLVVTVPLRGLAVLVLLLALPVTQGATMLPALRSAGWVAGRLTAACGGRSNLYAEKHRD